MTIELVVFDMAGTTVWDGDDAVAAALCAALGAAGVDVPLTAVDPVMGIPKPEAIAHLLREDRGTPAAADEVASIHTDFQSRIVNHYRTSADVREMDGATEVFAALRERGIRVTLDTGFDRAILDTIVERLGWTDALDATISSDEVEQGRPAPDMIRALMHRCGITDPTRVAKIGDSESDILEGLNAGCGLVGAVLCERTRSVLDQHHNVHAVASLHEFLRLVLERDNAAV